MGRVALEGRSIWPNALVANADEVAERHGCRPCLASVVGAPSVPDHGIVGGKVVDGYLLEALVLLDLDGILAHADQAGQRLRHVPSLTVEATVASSRRLACRSARRSCELWP